MKSLVRVAATAAISVCLMSATAAVAQRQSGQAIVSLYHGLPGHQEELIRWLANQDRVAAAAGVPATQLYVHTDGDSWDFMLIQPVTTDAQAQAMDAAATKLGLPSGPRAGLEFRKHIQSHTDTFVRGPMTASEYLQSLGPSR